MVTPGDGDKAAFSPREWLFRFVRMPFWLRNAPSSFQRVIDAVVRGTLWVCALVYFADVITSSRDRFGSHVVEVAAVLE